jgi:lipopolysaccharide/colanic/teichoic acid biosynthesis glycosyltransferase
MGAASECAGERKIDIHVITKRLMDVFMSAIALVVLTIPLIIIAAAIILGSKGPPHHLCGWT